MLHPAGQEQVGSSDSQLHRNKPVKTSVQTWVRKLDSASGLPALVIEGPTPLLRAEAYRWIFDSALGWTAGDTGNLDTSWVQEGLVVALTQRLAFSSSQKPSWDLLYTLLDVEDFVVEGALRKLLDHGFRFTEFYQALWEARHLYNEGRHDEGAILVEALIRWMTAKPLSGTNQELLGRVGISRELISPQDRLDLLFFLLALARQNGIVDRTVVVFDSFELAVRQGPERRRTLLQEMLTILNVATRWHRLSSGVGVVLGFTEEGGTLTTLRKYNPKLYQQVHQAWRVGVADAGPS